MSGPKPTLAFLCGLLSDERVWAPVAEALAPRWPGRIFAFPGHASLETMARAVLDATEGPLVLIGHSMGGRVALEAARQAPARAAGLVLANTGVHPPAPAEAAGRQKLIDIARADGMAALADAWLPPMLGAARAADLLPEMRAMVTGYTLDDYCGQIAALLGRPDAGPVLAGFPGPVLLLAAEEDGWAPPAQHAAMHALAPRATYTLVPDAGHMLPVEAPAAVAAALGNWLDATFRKDLQ